MGKELLGYLICFGPMLLVAAGIMSYVLVYEKGYKKGQIEAAKVNQEWSLRKTSTGETKWKHKTYEEPKSE